MYQRIFPMVAILSATVLMSGCGGADMSDLRRYVAQVQARPAPPIAPMPEFKPYESFTYSAASLRSPFEPPLPVKPTEVIRAVDPDLKPDKTRPREYLEEFNFDALRMVGTLGMIGDTQWALINDGAGGIHRVKEGNYLGRNHGRIIEISDIAVSVVEIVPDGRGGWVERPRTIPLVGSR